MGLVTGQEWLAEWVPGSLMLMRCKVTRPRHYTVETEMWQGHLATFSENALQQRSHTSRRLVIKDCVVFFQFFGCVVEIWIPLLAVSRWRHSVFSLSICVCLWLYTESSWTWCLANCLRQFCQVYNLDAVGDKREPVTDNLSSESISVVDLPSKTV